MHLLSQHALSFIARHTLANRSTGHDLNGGNP